MPDVPGTINFPTTLDTPVSLIETANLAGTTLSAGIGSGDLSIPLTSAADFPASGIVTLVDSLSTATKIEMLVYTSKTGTDLIVPTGGRGQFGTSAQSWTAGQFVQMRHTAQHHETLADAIIALETKVGAGVTDLPTQLALKAPLASPALSGVPTAPTAAGGTNTTQIATTQYVRTEINTLVAAAPGTLDTLDELAAALGDDANFAATVTASIATKASTTAANIFTQPQGVNISAANALFAGPNGDTNPSFRAVTNTASANTGVEIVGTAAGVGPFLRVISTGTNECLIAVPKGTGNFIIFTGRLQFGGTAAGSGDRAIDSPSAGLIRVVTGNGGAFLQFAAKDFLMSDATVGTSGAGVFALKTATIPTTSPVDVCQLYVQDAAAGKAELVVRNEAGELATLSGLGIRASAQFDKTSDVTLANIPGLTRDLKAGEIFKLVVELPTVSSASGGIGFAIGGTATFTTLFAEAEVKDAGVLKVPGTTRITAVNTLFGDVLAVTAARATLVVIGVTNAAGTITAMFRQHTSFATPSSVLSSASMVKHPI
jgi:hypothetical protein